MVSPNAQDLFFARIFGLYNRDAISVGIDADCLLIKGGEVHALPFSAIGKIEIIRGLIWNLIQLHDKGGRFFRVRGLPKNGSYKFLSSFLEKNWEGIRSLFESVVALLSSSHYCANREINASVRSVAAKSYIFEIPLKLLDVNHREIVQVLN